jgi:cyanate permease
LFGLLHEWNGHWAASYVFVALSLVVMGISGFRERDLRTMEDDIPDGCVIDKGRL